MEILSITTIKILLLFLPGIIYCLVHEKITFHPKREFNYFLIRSFVFGVLSYFIYGMYITIFQGKTLEDVNFLKYITSSTNIDDLQVNEIFFASICAIIWAIIYAWLKNQHVFENLFSKDFYKKFYKKEHWQIYCPFKRQKCPYLKIPYLKIDFIHILKFFYPFKVCESDVWNTIFNSNDVNMRWISISDNKLKLRYEGWVYKYSDTYKENELFLKDVIVYDEDDEELKRLPGLYITRKPDDITIEFFAIQPTELIDRYDKEENNDE